MRKNGDISIWLLFFRTVELGSFTKAAEEFGLELSSVSRRISKLEQQLEIPLFHRSGRTVQVTAAGSKAYDLLRPLLNEFDAVVNELSGQASNLRGNIRLSLPTTLGRDIFVPWVFEFQKKNPDVHIDVHLTHRQIDLTRERFDFVVRSGYLSDDRTVARPLGSVPRVMIATPNYVAEYGTPKHPDELSQHKLVNYTENMGNKALVILRKKERVVLHFDSALRLNNDGAIGDAVLADMGIAVVGCLYKYKKLLDEGRLVHILPDWELPPVDIHFMRMPTRRIDPCVVALTDWFIKKWSQEPLLTTHKKKL